MLLVVAIIALLIGILLPVLGKSKSATHKAICLSNLHAIHSGSVSYALSNRGKFPDGYTTGNHAYRMAPGKTTPNDPAAAPEVYGWAAALEKGNHFASGDSSWVCPASLPWMQSLENSYAFSIASVHRKSNPKVLLLWDNYTLYPGVSGFRGPFSGYTIPAAQRVFPHELPDKSANGAAAIYVGGNAQIRAEVD